jgi:hypothetical protein
MVLERASVKNVHAPARNKRVKIIESLRRKTQFIKEISIIDRLRQVTPDRICFLPNEVAEQGHPPQLPNDTERRFHSLTPLRPLEKGF